MTVRVKCFAIARDLAGFAERSFELTQDATAGEALATIVAQFPALAVHANRLALAVNLEYVDRSHVLRDGDELALIPPVSGGALVTS
ncbi:MAG TPA: molybdopterin converting factor subunit 1 [Tepidisphaeraceae bacterium]